MRRRRLMHWTRRRRIVVVAVGCGALLVVVGLALWSPALPWAANHYSFALPGKDGLPYYLHYNGRRYATQGMCARAGWCAGQPRTCESQARLVADELWPLRQVDQVNTPLGPSYPILMPGIVPADMTTTLLFVPYQGCYQVYALEGGP